MNVLLLISDDARFVVRMRQAAGGRALVLHSSSVDNAVRMRPMTPDLVLFDCGGSLCDLPWDSLRAVAPGRPVVVVSTRRDPMVTGGFLEAGVRAVIHPEDIGGQLERLTELASEGWGTYAPAPSYAVVRRAADNASANWEAVMRCYVRFMGTLPTQEQVGRLAVEMAQEGVQATRVGVLLREPGDRLAMAGHLNLSESIRLAYRAEHGRELCAALEADPRLLRRGDGELYHAGQRLVALFGGELCAPIIGEGGLEGALLLGGPAGGAAYNASQEDLILHVARLLGKTLAAAREREDTQAAQELYDWSLADAPVGLVCLDADLRVDAMNAEAQRLLGVAREDAAGRSVQALHSELSDAALRMESGETPAWPMLVRRPSGGGLLELRGAAGGNGRIIFSISESHEPAVAREQALQASLWESLASRMAQEIKNPLVAINTFAQLLPRKYDSADFRATFSKVMQEEVDRINRVVDTLHRFSREPELRLERLDINARVRDVVDAFAAEIGERGIYIESKLAETPLAAEIDPDAFKVVLQSLMQNAVDALPEGGNVSVSAAAGASGVEIRVEDTGRGISADDAKRVFDPFYSSRERGTGLGLSVAKKLVEAHEGTLELDEGAAVTRFILRFPTMAGARAGGVDEHADNIGN